MSASRLRIAMVTSRFWPTVGGIETQLAMLAQDLAQRHQVKVVTVVNDQGNADPYRLGVFAPSIRPYSCGEAKVVGLSPTIMERVLALPTLIYYTPKLRRWCFRQTYDASVRAFSAAFRAKLARLLDGADVVYTPAIGHVAHAAAAAARALGVPFVIKPHVHPGQYGDDPKSMDLLKRADAVVALQNHEREFYVARGVAAERCHVVAIAPVLAGEPDPAAFRRDHGIDGPLILFLGRQDAYKGVDLLLDAAPRIWQHRPDVHFAFLGPPGESLFGACTDRRLHRLGIVDERTKTNALAACQVLCLPSRFETHSAAILEAWSLGRPVIAGDIPALSGLVRHGVDGLVVPHDAEALAQAIERVVGDPILARRLGDAGCTRVTRQYARPAIARLTEAVLRSVCRLPQSHRRPIAVGE